MTRDEYIAAATEAVRIDIEERWMPRTKEFDPSVLGLMTCHLDTLACKMGKRLCATCPLESCGNEEGIYEQWAKAKTTRKRFAAAQAMIDFLRAWDIPTWADMLVKKGVLEP